jgi:hypothetical protein
MEQILDLLLLEAELGGVVKVLVLAAPALAEIAAERRNAVGGGLEDPHQARTGKPLLHLRDLRLDDFPDRHEWHEDDEFLDPRNPLPAKGNVTDGQSQLVADGRSLAVHNGRIR